MRLGPWPEYKLEGTPIMVKGVVYATAGTRRSVIALDAATGELLWVHGEHEGARGAAAARQLSGRGLSYWSDGKGDDRIVYITPGYRLVALDAKTGVPIKTFGNERPGRHEDSTPCTGPAADRSRERRNRPALDARRHQERSHSRGFCRSAKAMRPRRTTTPKGWCSPSTSRPGKKLWQFNTIPRPGEFGNDTWLRESWATNGNTGVWTQIAVDEQLGLAYLPVETPTSDYYGGHRPGNNLFAETLVCVDLKTGQRKWHFQLVHHPIWDYDISSAPMLADINVDGKADQGGDSADQTMLALRVRSRHRPTGVADRGTSRAEGRRSGRMVFAHAAHSPPSLRRTRARASPTNDLIDFTPALRAEAVKIVSQYRARPHVYAAGVEQARRSARDADACPPCGRNKLAGRGIRSGNAHRVCLCAEHDHPARLGQAARQRILGYGLRSWDVRASSSGLLREARAKVPARI